MQGNAIRSNEGYFARLNPTTSLTPTSLHVREESICVYIHVYVKVKVTSSLPANCWREKSRFRDKLSRTNAEPVHVKYKESVVFYAVVYSPPSKLKPILIVHMMTSNSAGLFLPLVTSLASHGSCTRVRIITPSCMLTRNHFVCSCECGICFINTTRILILGK